MASDGVPPDLRRLPPLDAFGQELRAAAVPVSPGEYENWKETVAIRSAPALMREIRPGLRALKPRKAKLCMLGELFR